MDQNSFEFERFFDISPDLLCIAGYDGYFKKINPAVKDALGYSYEELYARPIHEFIHPDDRALTAHVRSELIRDNVLLNFENRYLTKSGEVIWLAWSSQPIDDQKLVFAIAKNITLKKRHESERNALLENINKINQNLKQLSFTAAHDLRAPVNNLMELMSFINTDHVTDKETVEMLDLLKYSISNLKDTLNRYVDRLKENQTVHITKENVNLPAVLDPILLSIKSLITSSKAKVQVDFEAFQDISFNKACMESIFLNLLSNSIKYCNPEVTPIISIRTRFFNGTKQLIIEDNGLGIDVKKYQDQIFGMSQSFHQNEDSKGIGLYLVHNHVTSMGGKIAIESEINQGTRFIIDFENEKCLQD